jgi:porphobilinogen synthase
MAIRKMMAENKLSSDDLVYPMFISEKATALNPIESMPGIFQVPLNKLNQEIQDISRKGINSVLLFGLPNAKDSMGSGAYAENGVVQQAIRLIKKENPNLYVITDVCLCEYTDHGHCGVIRDMDVVNDETLELLTKTAISHAISGADMVAPSAMMDGQVSAIREGLDKADFSGVSIMAYSAKYASSFYGPFREAAESAPQFGDRLTYQMNFANGREALREIRMDIEEGADIILIKPALTYLDVISRAREAFDCVIAAYNVSGEYSMVKAAGNNGWIDESKSILEILTSIKRAGADIIISYHAKDVCELLKNSES